MATKVAMPKLGLVMTEGILVKWLREDGQAVQKGEPIAIVMSKKITYQVAAPTDGILRCVARVKETRAVGEPIAFVAAAGEELLLAAEPALASRVEAVAAGVETNPAAPATSATEGGFIVASPAARRLAKDLGLALAQVNGSGPGGRVTEEDVRRFAEVQAPPREILASPMAKKLAAEHGLDLGQISGTGTAGRVTEKDVQAFVAARQKPVAEQAPPALGAARGRTIPFAGLRQMVAQNMLLSPQTMAQVTLSTEVDVTEMVKMREQIKIKFDLTYPDILVKAVAVALKEHLLLNATLVGDEIHLQEEIHIGVAVALEDGLIVPVVRDADKLTLREIAAETRRLAEAARAGMVQVDEVTGSTFTITNLGTYRIDAFTPVINPPEVAILGVGRIIEKPAVFAGEIVKRALMALSLTFDHRIVDGAPAAAFLRTLAELLESPYLLFA